MTRNKLARRMSRPVRDFLMGLAFCAMIALSSVADRGPAQSLFANSAHAQLVEIIMETPDPVSAAWAGPVQSAGRNQQQMAAMIILALVVSSLLSLNLWFIRHVRRAYISPKRRGSR